MDINRESIAFKEDLSLYNAPLLMSETNDPRNEDPFIKLFTRLLKYSASYYAKK